MQLLRDVCRNSYISTTSVVLINYADYIISIELNKTKNQMVEFFKGHLGRFGGRQKSQFSAKVRNSDLDSFYAIPMCDTCYIPFFWVQDFIFYIRIFIRPLLKSVNPKWRS